MSQLKEQVDFSRIRYANCWEDAQVLLDSLQLQPGARCLIIASGGDNALALLSTAPKTVRAIDLSTAQLHVCSLKQAAFAHLERNELLHLLGAGDAAAAARWKLYQHLRSHLSSSTQSYWDDRRRLIEAGIIHQGKFEQYFRWFRNWLLPLVHSRTAVAQLLQPKTDIEQAAYFKTHWNSWRWKLLMGFFFSRAIMGRYGRDPQFLKHVAVNVPAYIRAKAEAHLQTAAATSNPFLHYIFSGSFGTSLPLYLQEQHYKSIKQNIGHLHLAEEDMDTAVAAKPYEVYGASNIFEYMSEATFRATAQRWSEQIPGHARIAFWNLMAPRSFSEALPELWKDCQAAPSSDNGFFYSRYLLECRL